MDPQQEKPTQTSEIPNTPPYQYQQPASTQSVQFQPPAKNPSRKRLFIPVFILLLILLAAVIYILISKENKDDAKPSSQTSSLSIEESQVLERKTVQIPDGWQTVETELGLSIKTPAGWIVTPVIDLTAGGIITRSVGITSSNAPTAPASIVDMATQYLENSTSQSEFEKVIKELSLTANSTPASSDNESKNKTTISKLYINDKEWTRHNTEFATGQAVTTLYWWDKDHAVQLSVLADNKDLLEKKINDYLLPVAASVKSN